MEKEPADLKGLFQSVEGMEGWQENGPGFPLQILTKNASDTAVVYITSSYLAKPLHIEGKAVIKTLKPIEEGDRFKHGSLEDRQQNTFQMFLLAARFMQLGDIHLCTILEEQEDKIYIGDIGFDLGEVDVSHEVGLLMRYYPEDRRLDNLLAKSTPEEQKRYLSTATTNIAHYHNNLPSLDQEGFSGWGSVDQLHKKCLGNLEGGKEFFLEVEKRHSHQIFAGPWVDNLRAYFEDKIIEKFQGKPKGRTQEFIKYSDLFDSLKATTKTLADIFASETIYKTFFWERYDEGKIKLCHGDITDKNTFIISEILGEETTKPQALDSAVFIDPIHLDLYNHIDILGDFAMFLFSLELNGIDEETIAEIRAQYLRETNQDNDTAADAVLDYYLLEKALVRAIVLHNFDNESEKAERAIQIGDKYQARVRTHMTETGA